MPVALQHLCHHAFELIWLGDIGWEGDDVCGEFVAEAVGCFGDAQTGNVEEDGNAAARGDSASVLLRQQDLPIDSELIPILIQLANLVKSNPEIISTLKNSQLLASALRVNDWNGECNVLPNDSDNETWTDIETISQK